MITEFPTNKALAEALGVNARRIYKWRKDNGAPAGRQIQTWHDWLAASRGRRPLARRLRPFLPMDAQQLLGDQIADTQANPTGQPLTHPPADATPAEIERHWRTAERREKARTAELQRRRLERDLIPVAEVHQILATYASATVEAITDTVWLALRPHLDLDAITAAHRKALRRAHDQAIADIRRRLARGAQDAIRQALSELPT